jgi:anti-anti-sigma factor
VTLADVVYAEHDQMLVVDVRGEVDMSNADELRAAIERRIAESLRGTVLDLSGLDYIDSTGIQLIFRLGARLDDRGQHLGIVLPAGSPAHDALRYAGVLERLRLFASLEDALAQL